MSEKEIMSKEAMNELINGFEIVRSLTEYGRKNIKYHFRRLQKENQQLKAINEQHRKINGKLREENQKQKEVIDKANKYINKMFNTGFYNDDYYLGRLKQILEDKEVE